MHMETQEATMQLKDSHSPHTIFWLQEGANSFGSHPRNNIVFPSPVAHFAGILFLKNDTVLIRTAESANITHQKKPIDNEVIFNPTKSLVLEVGLHQFQVIHQNGKLGVEIKKTSK